MNMSTFRPLNVLYIYKDKNYILIIFIYILYVFHDSFH